jgi:hypothetical protein
MKRNRTQARLLAAAATLATLACATTTFQSTWRSPDARPLKLSGKKVVGVFVSKNQTLRRRAEDAMAREISARGAQGVPAYTILTDEEVKDREAAKGKLEQLGFSGAVVMRVVGTQTQYTYEPAYWNRPYYHRFWGGGYWSWGWGTVWEPGYLVADKIVTVETLVYSLEQDLLVWAGVSKTVDPAQIDPFSSELATAVTKQMAKDGLLAQGG